jgi:hypothetical protein
MALHDHNAASLGMPIKIRDIGKSIGLSGEEAFLVAEHLRDRGWIKFEGDHEVCAAFITGHGVEEVERLRLPRWKRALSQPGVIAGAIAGLASGLLLSVVKYVFGLP